MKKQLFIFLMSSIFSVLIIPTNAQELDKVYLKYLIGHWTFDNPEDLTKASKGNDLKLFGTQTAIAGPDNDNGAVKIGSGSYYLLNHGLSPNGGGENVNEYTIVFDVKIPELGHRYSLYQTDLSNQSGSECFISDYGNIGISYYTPTVLLPNEWYRIGLSIKNGEQRYYYIDGSLELKGITGVIDNKFSLHSNGLLLFADDAGNDHEIDVAEVMLFSKALTREQMKDLGGFHDKIPIARVAPDTIINPYLQTPTESSIYVCWHASNSTSSIVEYGITNSLGLSQKGENYIWKDSTTWHWVKLTGLKPQTVYYYRAISDTLKSEIYKFKTAPPIGQKNGHIRFAIIGDTRTYPDQFTDIVTSVKEKVAETYGDSNIESKLNLILCNGDIVSYGPILSQYKKEWFEPLAGITGNVPMMVSIGDHEHDADNYYYYMKYEDFAGDEGEKYYSFKYGRILFIAIHSMFYSDIQIQWLDSLLQSAQTDSTIDWIFAYTHRPGHSEIWPNGNEYYIQNRVIPVLQKYSKVDLLTYGHSHAYERGQVIEGNVRLLENGGGGAELDRWREYDNQTDYPEIQKTFDYWSYTIVDVDIKNKRYDATSYALGSDEIKLDNIQIDYFFRDKKDQTPPQKPDLISPKNKKKIDLLTKLKSSTYKGKYKILSSQFQISEKATDFSNPIVNCKRDFENYYLDSGAPDFVPINKNANIDLTNLQLSNYHLNPEKQYWWRVRYRDRNLQWSDWSETKSFKLKNK